MHAYRFFRVLIIYVLAVSCVHAQISDCSPELCLSYSGLWVEIAEEYGVDPILLYSVALRESRRLSRDGLVRPYPWTLNGPNGAERFDSQKSAEKALVQYVEDGYRNIDVGWLQINIKYNGHRVSHPVELLNPIMNTRIGAQILAEELTKSPNNLIMGIGRYHAGYNAGSEKRALVYGEQVYNIYNRIREYLEVR